MRYRVAAFTFDDPDATGLGDPIAFPSAKQSRSPNRGPPGAPDPHRVAPASPTFLRLRVLLRNWSMRALKNRNLIAYASIGR